MRLSDVVDQLDVGLGADELAAAFGARARLDARLAEAVGAFDEAELWRDEGATSATAWLVDVGLPPAEAARVVARARALRRLPATAAAARSGKLGAGQLDAVVANTRGPLLDRFAEHEEELLPRLARLSPRDAAVAMQHWRSRAHDGEPAAEPERHLYVSRLGDGQTVLDGTFDVESGEILAAALRVAESRDVEGEAPREPARRRADALVDLCRHFLDHQQQRKGGRHRPHLNVVLRAESGETTTLDGRLIAESVRDTWLCDSVVHRCVLDADGAILDYGRAARSAPAPLFNALVVRDGGCRFPGCDRPVAWCDVHHLHARQHGGGTSPANCALFCSRHHHLIHRPGWHAKLRPDSVVEVTRPDGRVLSGRPRGPDPPRLC